MATGIQPSWSQLNSQAGQIIIAAREALQDIIFFNLYLQSVGEAGLTALATAAQDATATSDAQTMLAVFSDLNEVAQMCNGGAAPANAGSTNFLAETAPFWGGQ